MESNNSFAHYYIKNVNTDLGKIWAKNADDIFSFPFSFKLSAFLEIIVKDV